MKFEKYKVYTSLDADDLKVGSKVIVADSMYVLRKSVEETEETNETYKENVVTLIAVNDCSTPNRFKSSHSNWNLAYLISEPQVYYVHTCGYDYVVDTIDADVVFSGTKEECEKYVEEHSNVLKWTDLKIGDVIRRKDGLKEAMVTLIDKSDPVLHIGAGVWIHDDELKQWEKVE